MGAGFSMGKVTVLFNQSGDKYAWVEDGVIRSMHAIDDSLSLFKNDVLGSVGAAIVDFPKYLYLFDKSGSQYTVVELDARLASGQWDNPRFFRFNQRTYSLREWGKKGDYPFSSVGSIWYEKTDRVCGPYVIDYGTYYMSNGSGNLFAKYQISTATYMGEIKSFDQYEIFTCGNKEGNRRIETHFLPITEVEAVVDYFGAKQELIGELFFTSEGKQFGYNELGSGEFMGPFDLY